MSKFKVGQKVKIHSLANSIRNPQGHMDYLIGTTQTVVAVRSDSGFEVKDTGSRLGIYPTWVIHDSDATLVEEKVAKKKILYPVRTRVKVVKNLANDSYAVGKSGIVASYTKVATAHRRDGVVYPYKVMLDNRVMITANVDELEKEVDSHPQETAKTPVKSITIKVNGKDYICRDGDKLIVSPQIITKEVVRTVVVNKVIAPKKAEEKKSMSTSIRQKLSRLTMSHEDKQLQKYEITSEFGNLTDLGRRVVMDYMFKNDADLRKAVVADLDAVEKEECKGKK